MIDIHRRTSYLFVALVLAQVLLISAQVNTASGVPLIEAVTFGAFAKAQRLTASVFHSVGDVWSGYVALRGVSAENTALRQQVAELQVELQEQRALAQRTRQLEQLLNLQGAVGVATVGAEVIAADPTPWFHTMTINRGAADGLSPDLAVLAPAGVVGRVVREPTAHAARVQLLIDPNAAAGVIVERSRAAGIVSGGDGQGLLRLDFVSNLADVVVGDRVVTSGTDGIYPRGFLVGHVAALTENASLYRSIAVRPVVDFRSLETVLVVVRPPSGSLGAGGAR